MNLKDMSREEVDAFSKQSTAVYNLLYKRFQQLGPEVADEAQASRKEVAKYLKDPKERRMVQDFIDKYGSLTQGTVREALMDVAEDAAQKSESVQARMSRLLGEVAE